MSGKEREARDKQAKANVMKNIDGASGEYCNLAAIHHSQTEFVFDFLFRLGDATELVSRVITSPLHAKALVLALEENLGKYEAKFGKIPAPGQSPPGGPGSVH